MIHHDINFFLKNPNYLFICLFLAVPGLCCCTWAFSSCGEWGLFSSCSAWAFRCSGFSCEAWALSMQALVAVACGLSSCSSWALEHRLNCPAAHEIFLDQRLNLCQCLTTEPPGKTPGDSLQIQIPKSDWPKPSFMLLLSLLGLERGDIWFFGFL